MTDLSQKFANAKQHLRPVEWSPERSDAVRRNIGRRRQRFTMSTVALGSAAVAVAVAVAIVWFAQRSEPNDVAIAPRQIELRDGTRAAPLGSATSLKLLSEDESLVTFGLEAGKGWFEVTPSRTRRVEVLVRDVRVQVLGTEFVVEVKDEFVHVWVHRGKVSVASTSGTVVLSKGEHGTFAADAEEEKESASIETDAGVAKAVAAVDAGMEAEGAKVREREGEADAGAQTIESLPAEVSLNTSETVETLWKRADTARRRGDAETARRALAELLNEHEEDPRAALAAFSLGRVLLDSGHSAKTAARAFAKARKLSPEGPLVEDALLREIEAWHHDGDSRRVKSRSKKYMRLFPKGRYRKQIREMGER